MDQLLFILDQQYPYLILNKKFLVIFQSVYHLNTININPNQVNLLKVNVARLKYISYVQNDHSKNYA